MDEDEEIIIHTGLDTKVIHLPGTIMMPDGKKSVQLGSGTITRRVSSGGMAIVYEIWNPDLEVHRAVKLLKPDHSDESEDRFHTEMKITAKLHHPNIVEIYSVGTWNNQLPYIEMELIDGLTLEKIINEGGRLPLEVCTSVAIMVGRALNYSHSQSYMLYGKRYLGVIHRDLKPGNIMVSRDGVVKLMDFGIAKPMTASIHTIEGAGTVMGTMQYLAPEQLDGKEVDARADLYALGTVLYEMITGLKAFGEQNIGKLIGDKLHDVYVPLTQYDAAIPGSLIALVQKLIHCDKEKRIQNVLEFLRAVCKIHKTLTLKPPEQVIEQFMASLPKEKHVARIKKRSGVLPVILWTVTTLAFAATIGFAMLHVRNKPNFDIREILSYVKSVVLSSAIADSPVDPRPISKRIDSVLALPPVHPHAPKEPLTQPVPDKQAETVSEHSEESQTAQTSSVREHIKLNTKKQPSVTMQPQPVQLTAPVQTQPVAAPPADPRLSDPMTIFTKAIENNDCVGGLALYTQLPQDLAASKKAKIYRLRALTCAHDEEGLKRVFSSSDVYDGEYYLEKARYYYNGHDFLNAQDFLRRASSTPCQFCNRDNFSLDILYVKALCAAAIFDQTKIEDTRKEAIDAFVDLKSRLVSSPKHPYIQKADAEIRRLEAAIAR